MNKRRIYYKLHLIHGLLILVLLLTGAVLYVPALRIFLVEYRGAIRKLHSITGMVYYGFILIILPYMVDYLRKNRTWPKTFHMCLQYSLGFGWATSGIYLWINDTTYLGVRQTALFVHDELTLFIIPWTLGHIGLWLLRKKGKVKPILRMSREDGGRDRGILISRRDVVILFAGGAAALLFGALLRWRQPLTEPFLASLGSITKRGYFRNYSLTKAPPPFDPLTWRLKVSGFVETPAEWSWDDLMQLPKVTFTRDFHCVTGWSVLGVEWEGIPFREVVKAVGPKQEGIFVKMYSADNLYTETYELAQLLEQNVIFAYKLDGKSLIPYQGAPLRLFHPMMHGYKSIKWLNRIEFTAERGLGYWEEKEGYDLDGYLS